MRIIHRWQKILVPLFHRIRIMSHSIRSVIGWVKQLTIKLRVRADSVGVYFLRWRHADSSSIDSKPGRSVIEPIIPMKMIKLEMKYEVMKLAWVENCAIGALCITILSAVALFASFKGWIISLNYFQRSSDEIW